MGVKQFSRYRLHSGLAILFLIVMVHLMITSPEMVSNIQVSWLMERTFLYILLLQVPVTLPLFVDYPVVTESSNNLDDGNDMPAGGHKVGQKAEESGEDDKENDASKMKTGDIKMNSTKSKLVAYKAKLSLIKDVNTAISEMNQYLTKNAVKSQSKVSTHVVHEDHYSDDVKHDQSVDKADKDEKVVSPNDNPSPSSGVWEAVRILSEKTGLVSSDEGFINIKPLVNLTVNTFGFFDDVKEEKDKPFDPNDTKTVLKSIFQIWNPRVSRIIMFKYLRTQDT